MKLTRNERILLVAMMRWARANGWKHVHGNWDCAYWHRPGVYRFWMDSFDGVPHIRVDDKVAKQGLVDFWPRSTLEAIGVLKAFNVIPYGVALMEQFLVMADAAFPQKEVGR